MKSIARKSLKKLAHSTLSVFVAIVMVVLLIPASNAQADEQELRAQATTSAAASSTDESTAESTPAGLESSTNAATSVTPEVVTQIESDTTEANVPDENLTAVAGESDEDPTAIANASSEIQTTEPSVSSEPSADDADTPIATQATQTENESEAEVEAGAEVGAENEAETEAGTENGTKTEAEVEAQNEVGTETDSEAGAQDEAGTEAENQTEGEAEAGTETEAETEAEAGTEAENQTEVGTETDAKVETDNEAETGAGAASLDEGAPEDEPVDAVEGEPDIAYPPVILNASANGVRVTLIAPEGVLPQGVQMRVTPVYRTDVDEAVESKVASEGDEVADSITLDVTLLDKDGVEIEPNDDVTLSFSNTALEGGDGVEAESEVSVYRVADDASTVTEMPTIAANADAQVITTDHFTIYQLTLKKGRTEKDIWDCYSTDVHNISEKGLEVYVGETIYFYDDGDPEYWSTAADSFAKKYFSVSPSSGVTVVKTGHWSGYDYYPLIGYQFTMSGEYTVSYDHENNIDTHEHAKAKIIVKQRTIEMSGLHSVEYNGEKQELKPVVVDKDTGTTLTEGVEYTLSYYGDTTNYTGGPVSVVVNGIGKYTGSGTAGAYKITKRNVTIDVDDAQKAYGDANPTFTGTVTGLVKEGDLGTITYKRTSNSETPGVYKGDITATCSSGNNYNVTVNKGNFTITKKNATITVDHASKFYGFDDPELTATVKGVIGSDTLNYTLSREKGENVGTYRITATLGDNPNYNVSVTNETFTIFRAPAMITINDAEKTYGDADPTFTYKIEDAHGPIANDSLGTVTCMRTNANVNDAGTYQGVLTATYEGNPNYAVVVETGNFTINKRDATIAVNDAQKEFDQSDPTFTGTVTGLVKEGDLGTITYSRTSNDEAVGTYEDVLTASYTPNDNYNVTVETGDFTITKAKVKVPAAKSSLVYEGPNIVQIGVTRGTGCDLRGHTGIHAGEYIAFAKLKDGYIWEDGTTDDKQISWSIAKAKATITADNKTKVYDNSDPELTATVEGTFTRDFLSFTLVRDYGENAGAYTIHVNVTPNDDYDNDDYDITTIDGVFTITQGTFEIEAIEDVIYNGQVQQQEPVVKDKNTGNTLGKGQDYELEYLSQNDNNECKNVGSVTIKITGKGNYTGTDYVSYRIKQKSVTIGVGDGTKVYGNPDPTFTGTVTGLVNDNDLGEITYSRTNADVEDAGSYADVLTASYTPNDNYNVTVTNGMFKITPAKATITVDNSTKVYGNPDPTFTGTVVGLVNEADLGEIAYVRSSAEVQDAGTYADVLTADYTDNSNYSVTVEKGDFVITARKLTVTADNKTKVYDGDATTDPELTATIEGLVAGDTLNYTLSRVEGQDADEYDININVVGDSNYTMTARGAKFTIAKAPVEIVVHDAAKTYGESDPSFTGTVTGLVADNDLGEIAYSRTNAGVDDAGSYADVLTANYTENGNYDVTVATGDFTINKKEAAVTADDAYKVYGNSDPEFTAAVTGAIDGEALSYTLSREEGEDSGEYAISVTPGDNPNYDVTATGGTLTIGKNTAILIPESKSKVYDNDASTDPELTAATTGTLEGDSLDYTLTRDEGQDVGTYAINVELGDNPNYDIAIAEASFEITPAEATVSAVDASKIYGAADPELTATVEDVAEGDTLNYSFSREKGEEPDNYIIAVVLGENPNYTVTTMPAVFTIEKADQTVTFASSTVEVAIGDDPVANPATASGVEGGAEPGAVTYTSSDTSVATVDADGTITFVGEGTATITAIAAATDTYNEASTTCTVTVKPAEAVSYSCTSGGGDTWTKGSSSTLDFTFERSVNDEQTFGLFEGVQVDGKAVDASNYTANAGSLKLSLNASYLDTLATGEHTLVALFEDGSAETSFTIKVASDNGKSDNGKSDNGKSDNGKSSGGSKGKSAKTLPSTGDNAGGPLAVLLLLVLGSAALVTVGALRRRASR